MFATQFSSSSFLFIVLEGGRRKGTLSELIFIASIQCFTDIYGMLIFFSLFQKRNLIAPRPAVKSNFLLAVQKIPSWLKAMLLPVNAAPSRAAACVILQAAWGRFASLAIWIYWFLRHQESQGNAVISMNVNQVKVDAIFFSCFSRFSNCLIHTIIYVFASNKAYIASKFFWFFYKFQKVIYGQ